MIKTCVSVLVLHLFTNRGTRLMAYGAIQGPSIHPNAKSHGRHETYIPHQISNFWKMYLVSGTLDLSYPVEIFVCPSLLLQALGDHFLKEWLAKKTGGDGVWLIQERADGAANFALVKYLQKMKAALNQPLIALFVSSILAPNPSGATPFPPPSGMSKSLGFVCESGFLQGVRSLSRRSHVCKDRRGNNQHDHSQKPGLFRRPSVFMTRDGPVMSGDQEEVLGGLADSAARRYWRGMNSKNHAQKTWLRFYDLAIVTFLSMVTVAGWFTAHSRRWLWTSFFVGQTGTSSMLSISLLKMFSSKIWCFQILLSERHSSKRILKSRCKIMHS